ncbi:hypothetical protein J6590_059846 [Homalodisca vitripennis]|nr:hypothetical protein J6590_059846 [Homalodisca vitripennis]
MNCRGPNSKYHQYEATHSLHVITRSRINKRRASGNCGRSIFLKCTPFFAISGFLLPHDDLQGMGEVPLSLQSNVSRSLQVYHAYKGVLKTSSKALCSQIRSRAKAQERRYKNKRYQRDLVDLAATLNSSEDIEFRTVPSRKFSGPIPRSEVILNTPLDNRSVLGLAGFAVALRNALGKKKSVWTIDLFGLIVLLIKKVIPEFSGKAGILKVWLLNERGVNSEWQSSIWPKCCQKVAEEVGLPLVITNSSIMGTLPGTESDLTGVKTAFGGEEIDPDTSRILLHSVLEAHRKYRCEVTDVVVDSSGWINTRAVKWGMFSTKSLDKYILDFASGAGLVSLNDGGTPKFWQRGKIPNVTITSLCSRALVRELWKNTLVVTNNYRPIVSDVHDPQHGVP